MFFSNDLKLFSHDSIFKDAISFMNLTEKENQTFKVLFSPLTRTVYFFHSKNWSYFLQILYIFVVFILKRVISSTNTLLNIYLLHASISRF